MRTGRVGQVWVSAANAGPPATATSASRAITGSDAPRRPALFASSIWELHLGKLRAALSPERGTGTCLAAHSQVRYISLAAFVAIRRTSFHLMEEQTVRRNGLSRTTWQNSPVLRS